MQCKGLAASSLCPATLLALCILRLACGLMSGKALDVGVDQRRYGFGLHTHSSSQIGTTNQ